MRAVSPQVHLAQVAIDGLEVSGADPYKHSFMQLQPVIGPQNLPVGTAEWPKAANADIGTLKAP